MDLKPYVVNRLVFSKESDRSGRFLASYETHGGLSSLRPFQLYTLSASRMPAELKEIEGATKLESDVSRSEHGYRIRVHTNYRVDLLDVVEEWCRDNPSNFLYIHGPGCTDLDGLLPGHMYYQHDRPLVIRNGCEALRCALANALNFEDARAARKPIKEGMRFDSRFGDASRYMQENSAHLLVEKVQKETMNYEQWMENQTHGGYMVQVKGYEEQIEALNHTVVVDFQKRRMYHNYHPYAIKYTLNALYLLIGNAHVKQISDVRNLRSVQVAKKTRQDNRKRKRIRKTSEKKIRTAKDEKVYKQFAKNY